MCLMVVSELIALSKSTTKRGDKPGASTFGELKGQVINVSADAKEPDEFTSFYSFPVTISLENDHLLSDETKIPLRSGMSIQANLRVRQKPIISLLSDLLVDKTESLKSIRQ